MTNLTCGFFGIQKVRLHDGAMRIVAHTALLEHYRLMSMDLGKSGPLVAIEAATLKNKTSALIYPVTLRTRHVGNGRMLMKRRKAVGRVLAHKKLHFLFPAIP